MAAKPPPVKRLIIQYARKYGLDPAAVIAVARGEGGLVNRANDIGDLAGGGSYGPFQLYAQGALPKRFRGNPKAADKWAWSPAGIDYAMRKMKEAGASGLKGEAAVNQIVRRFERPAKPDASVAAAVGRLGSIKVGQVPGAAPSIPRNGQTIAAPDLIPAQARGTLNDIFKKVGLKPLDIVGDLPLPTTSVPGRLPSPSAAAGPALPKPLPKGTKMPRLNLMVTAIQKAQAMGLTVRENPYVDPVGKSHVKGSHHYQTIGTKKGRKVGGAIDVSGDPKLLMAYFRWAEQYAGRGLNDLFHDPAGYSYDRGKRWGKTIGGHQHVHFSV